MTTTNTEVPQVFDVDTVAAWLTAQRDLPAAVFLTAVARVGRMHGPAMLAQAVMAGAFGSTEGFTWRNPALAEQAKATAAVWSDCDRPSLLLSAGDWTALFGMLGFTVDGAYADQPEEPVRLYRGATDAGKHGMAWTSDVAAATQFAAEHGQHMGGGKVWTAVIAPDHLLAQITLPSGAVGFVVDPAAFDPESWESAEVEEYITTQAAAAAASAGKLLVPHLFEAEEMASWIEVQRDFTAEAFEEVEKRVGHNGAAHILLKAAQAGAFCTDELAAALTSVWTGDGKVSSMLSLESWRFLFTKAGYAQDGVPAERPAEPIRLYRGATVEGKLGMSWTSDLATAQFFTIPTDGDEGAIWTATFEPEDLLAHITTRDESEYVVDPEILASGLVKVEEHAAAYPGYFMKTAVIN